MIITTDTDVLVFPNWSYGRIQRYTRRQALLDPILDPDNDRIIGENFSSDPDYNELRVTEFTNSGDTKILTDWLSIKKHKFEETEL